MLGFLKNVLGGGGDRGEREPEGAEPVEHEGFTIIATPRKASGGWSTEGRIRKDIDGETKEAHFIRADTSTSREAAISLSVSKARKIIDEQGERVFRATRA
ncbi:MAG: HlyU family transcriptional regulator [Thiotrichales bacterium]|nr:HlyU family transcriptional regulator [Thiotrichales bacterium]